MLWLGIAASNSVTRKTTKLNLREFISKIVLTKPLPRQIYYCGLFCLFVSWPNMDLNKRKCDLGHLERWEYPTEFGVGRFFLSFWDQ